MNTYFVDASYWIARSDPRDQLHQRAMKLGRKLGSNIHLVTTKLVLIEWLDATSSFGDAARKEIVHQIHRMEEADNILIVSQNEYVFRSALADYERFADQEWSFTDCTSFLVMRKHQIHDALTYDHHFEQAGFRALLRK